MQYRNQFNAATLRHTCKYNVTGYYDLHRDLLFLEINVAILVLKVKAKKESFI